MRELGILDLTRYVDAFDSFDVLTKNCFRKELLADYLIDLENFKQAFKNTNIKTKSTKFHILFSHLPEFLEKTNKGLGLYSEQAGETLHSRFRQYAESKLPKNHTSESYAESLKKIILSYNIERI